ncbi:MAG: phosphate-starvation-inducible PsiE family protein [Xenococcaceae cyanobacterium MO_234.B1]|nr:phosphate-starvation-inducible PsiE family protein [Xenococcaceae cyanobacterium MO_234.B1]
MQNPLKKIRQLNKDENFLNLIHLVENTVAKILSLALLIVILLALVDLILLLYKDIFHQEPVGLFRKKLLEIFGLFLNILIALELLENITAYLKRHVVQLELVLVTSLIAVSRKIIIFDLDKKSNEDLMALGIATLCLSVGYVLVRLTRDKKS